MIKIGIFNLIKDFKSARTMRHYAKMMNGSIPIFNDFGNDVYASDIVQNAIRCIASQIGKLNPQHIRTVDGLQSIINSDINRLLKYGPNPLMTTTDFLEKIVYQREINKNAYIYPTWNKIPLGNGTYKREYTGFYPLNPTTVEYIEEETTGRLWIRFYFADGVPYDFPYEDIIHWRKDYTANDFCGGDKNGEPNNKALLKLLQTDDIITQGIDKGIKTALSVRGILNVKTMLDDEKQEEARKEFESKMLKSESGILAADLKGEYTPISVDPKFIPKDTIEFIENRILANYGVSLPIYNGTFTEEEYQAFYEKVLESMIISLGRVFSKTLFTKRELEVGNEIIFYNQGLQFMNTTNKINAADILTKLGTLTDNQVLAIFGYPPFEGGNTRRMSLNYINREIADTYQLTKTKGKENTSAD